MSLSCTVSEILSLITEIKRRHVKGQFVIPVLKHHMANQCTKFQVSSFSRFGDILGGNKNLNRSLTITTPLSGTICHRCAGTSYDSAVYQIWNLLSSLSTKIWKVTKNAEIVVGLGLGVAQGHRQHSQGVWLCLPWYAVVDYDGHWHILCIRFDLLDKLNRKLS